MATPNPLDSIVSLAKRRGFVYQAGEIYGGSRSAWDYGPLGTALKENIKREWWKFMVQFRDDIVGIDSSVILPRQVWEASGHVEVFSDPLVESLHTHKRFRADHLLEAYEEKHGHPPVNGLADINDPDTGQPGAWTEPRNFSGLLKTFLGPVDDEEGMHYLRPETAQGIFTNFNNVSSSARMKPPFGIAQVGKSFRNEITPGNFIFRTREFEQMEMEFFVEPGTDEEWFDYWIDACEAWFLGLGLRPDNVRRYEHPKEKLSHYSKRTIDLEYRFRFGGSEWGELMGVANRTDFDLKTHSEHSGVDLSYFDQTKNERWIPYVIEPAFGLTRALMAFLVDSYSEDEAPNTKGGVDKRTVLRLDRRLAPVKVAVLPLSRNEQLSPVAKKLADDLRRLWMIEFDDAGAIGRRYRRQDEIGTPFAVTVDFDTLDDQAVTVRERDTMGQERVGLDRLAGYLSERLLGGMTLPSLRYHRLLRGLPQYRWWKPLLALLVAAFLWVVFQVVVAIAVLALVFALGLIRLDSVAHAQADLLSFTTLDAANPLSLVLALGSVVTLLPAVLLAYLIVGLRPIGTVRSIAFRLRWRWLAACLVPAVAITVIASALQLFVLPLLLGGWPVAPSTPIGDWILCAVLILIVTPLQAAAEEFGFRGLVTQMLGSWVRWAPFAIVVAAIPFTVLHTQYWGWATADVAVFALIAGYVTWRTGGLEAGIALHSANNTIAFLLLSSGIYGSTANTGGAGDPWSLLVTIVTMGLYALWIDRMARRRALKAVLEPLPPPAAPDPATLVAE